MTFFTTSPGTVPVYSVRTSLLSAPPRTLSPFSTSVVAGSSEEKPGVRAHQLGRVGGAVLPGSMSWQPVVSGSCT